MLTSSQKCFAALLAASGIYGTPSSAGADSRSAVAARAVPVSLQDVCLLSTPRRWNEQQAAEGQSRLDRELAVRTIDSGGIGGSADSPVVKAEPPGTAETAVSPERMRAIYEEVKTPFKYGLVLEPPAGKKVDCPTVFRHGDRWWMVYVQLETKPAEGYTTQLAASDDLLRWKPLGTIVERGGSNDWDHANAGGGIALFDTKWGGGNTLRQHEGRYWLSYLGGKSFGYETLPLAVSLASTADPAKPEPWRKLPAPVMKPDDPDARPELETKTLYKSYIFRDDSRTLGAPFVMFYNAKGSCEQIFTAVSQDLKTWKRFGAGPAVENLPPSGPKRGVISGDPQIVRMDGLWVMFYFGAFWQPGAFDTFAASPDLVHWTKWTGEHLVKPSEAYDTPFAHKPWLLKHNGVVYHFYCAVGKQDHRAIALATSREQPQTKANEGE